MGAKQSKGGKVSQNGQTEAAENSEGLDTFNKTSTLPATFRNGKEDDVTKTGTLPREGVANLDRNTSFSKRFRKSVSKLIGNGDKDPKTDLSPQKESKADVTDNGESSSPKKENTPRARGPMSPVDHKIAQKMARAKFFQELYTTPTNVPKPPRSHNVSMDNGSVEGDDGKTTPVVKLIEKHTEAIEKHQEDIRASMGSPDVLQERLDSFRKSKVIENSEKMESMKKEEMRATVTKTESSFKEESNVMATETSITKSASESIRDRKSVV